MEKEFIPYEQALVLKELGFDEPCLVFWTNTPKYKGDNIQLCITDGMHGYSPDSISFKQDFLREGEVLAPLYQQAFRWFRDKHNLHCNIDPWGYCIYDDNQTEKTGFKSYKKSQTECLKKLIEIVKE
jgi:hypothetical protein